MSISILPAKRWTSEWWLQLFLAVVWAKALVGYARGIILRIPIIGEFVDEVEYLFYIVPLLGALPIIFRIIRIYDIVFYLTCLCILLFSHIININSASVIEEYAATFLFSIVPLYFAGRFIDFPKLEKAYTIISVVSIIASIYYIGVYVRSGLSSVELSNDNMGASYALLPYQLFLIASIFKRFSLFKLVLSSIAILFTLSLGTRGPLLCITVFVSLMVLFNTKAEYKRTILFLIVVFGAFTYIYIEREKIMSWLLNIFTDLELSTRIIDKYLSGTMDDDSGRGSLQRVLWNLLNDGQHPLGYGLFSSWYYIKTYPHNFMLDIFFSFGYVIGGGLLVSFFIIFFKAVKRSRLEVRSFLFVLFCTSFVKLTVSSTFVLEPYLFFLIGYCVSINNNRTREIQNRQNSCTK